MVGASGAIFGVIGAQLADVALNFDSLCMPWLKLGVTLLVLLVVAGRVALAKALLKSGVSGQIQRNKGALVGSLHACRDCCQFIAQGYGRRGADLLSVLLLHSCLQYFR